MVSEDVVPAARRLWRLLEPYHGIIYFAKEAREEFTRTGLKGAMMSYIACRAAPLGTVPAAVVTAALYNLHPKLVRYCLPRAWELAAPEVVVEARLTGVDRVLGRLGYACEQQRSALCEAGELTRIAMETAQPQGRPMFAANAELPWPEEPHLALWHGATLVREHRGDGHATALLHEEVDGCEAHTIVIASGVVGKEWVRYRGWNEEDCAAAEERLRSRGWLDKQGGLTESGWKAHVRIEQHTDRLCGQMWRHIGESRVERLTKALECAVEAVVRSDVLPDPYPPVG